MQAKDQEERALISSASETAAVEDPRLSTSQDTRTGEQGSTPSSDVLERPPLSSHAHDVERASQPSHSPGLPPMGKGRDWQPEAWTPQTIRRRGG
jgi:hypothetical protein